MQKKENPTVDNKDFQDVQTKLLNVKKSTLINDYDVNHGHNAKKEALGPNTNQN